MKTQFRVHLPDAFAVDADHIKKIHTLLKDRIGDVKIEATCADSAHRQCSSATELIAYENPSAKRIEEMTFRAHSEDFKKEVLVRFAGSGWAPRIRIEIDADDDVVERLQSRLHEILRGSRRWYYRVRRFDIFSAIFGMGLLIGMGGAVYIAVNCPPEIKQSDLTTRGVAQSWLIASGSIVTLCVLAYALSRIRDKWFPHGVFLIGQEKEVDQTAEKVRWTVVIAFGVSLAASLVLPFLAVLVR